MNGLSRFGGSFLPEKNIGYLIVLFFILSLFLSSFVVIAEEVSTEDSVFKGTFEENFENLDNWYLVVYDSAGGSSNDAAPKLDDTRGSPDPPSLDVNGNSWCGDGTYSKEVFDYTAGLTIEFDMYVASGYDWNWGRCGLSDHLPNLNNQRSDGAYVDKERCSTSHLARVNFVDDGDHNGKPASLLFSIKTENGSTDSYMYSSNAVEYQNEWHTYKIEIQQDGYVNFFMDDKFICISNGSIDKSLGAMPILLGERDANGPVRVDNVKVYYSGFSLITIAAIVGVVAGGSTLIVFFGATGLGKFKVYSFLAFLGAPLFTKMVKDDVFDNQKRLCMYNHIAENQPVVYSNIKKACKLSDGEINWHAHIMVEMELIRMERKGFHLFFKIYGKRLPPAEFVRLTDIQKKILELISEGSAVTQAEIVDKTGVKQQNVSYNILKLERNGKIRVAKKGKTKYYYLSDN